VSAEDHPDARAAKFVAACAAVVLAIAGVSACGGDDDDEPAQNTTPRATPAVAAGPALEEDPDPGTVNCSHLANRENYQAAYQAAYTLAKDVKLPDASEKTTASRILAAMNGLCEKRPEADYRPAEDAVAAVKRGEYKSQGGLK
jgi:hypothetical protein